MLGATNVVNTIDNRASKFYENTFPPPLQYDYYYFHIHPVFIDQIEVN